MKNVDVVIVGSGLVGATTALALANLTPLRIALLEEKSQLTSSRMSAISLASKRILQKLNVWNEIETNVSPYEEMFVWDELSKAKLSFSSKNVNVPQLGYIVEDNLIRNQLLHKITATPQIEFIQPIELQNLERDAEKIILKSEKENFSAKLIIGADGANSWVRNQANIPLKTRSYKQIAMTATVKTELPHQKTAWQCFLTSGPLAFLPLQDQHQCSIVWSADEAYAKELLLMNNNEFANTLTKAFQKKLGNVELMTERFHFPLTMRHAKQYVQNNLALVGDAAHTLHPLAGQE